MYAFLLKWDPTCTPRCDGVRIVSHFYKKKAYMHKSQIDHFVANTDNIYTGLPNNLVYALRTGRT